MEPENALHFLTDEEFTEVMEEVEVWAERLESGDCASSELRGWLKLPQDRSQIHEIRSVAERLRGTQTVVVAGIGGSYLGARAVVEALNDRVSSTVYYAGNHLSGRSMAHLISQLDESDDWCLLAISKSGTTLETALAFRVLRRELVERFGPAHRDRLVLVTDPKRGALRKLADERGYLSLCVPEDVGGRFSVMSAVGLLPIHLAGLDIERLLEGAQNALECARRRGSDAKSYAGLRQALYRNGVAIEVLSVFEPSLHYIVEWWKQLFGESEGKSLRGIFPAGAEFTTDLHSLGQYLQEGTRNLMESFLWVDRPGYLTVPDVPEIDDGLAPIVEKDINEINLAAFLGTRKAHREGGVPNLSWILGKLDEEHLGAWMATQEYACAVSALVSGVNPFDQPGVDAYKRNVREILGL